MLFMGVKCCSRGLYAVQEDYMDVQEGYMLKKIMMFLVATNVVASQSPERQPTGMLTAKKFELNVPLFFSSEFM